MFSLELPRGQNGLSEEQGVGSFLYIIGGSSFGQCRFVAIRDNNSSLTIC